LCKFNATDYVTCIASGKSSSTNVKEAGKWVKKGHLKMSGNFNWTQMRDNGKAEKFWIVPSTDVDCANNKFLAWNPDNYLFETKTI
jgi:hypothetical protein